MTLSKKTIEGVIDEVRDGIVIATLVDHSGWSYYAEIDLDRFADSDQPQCVPGVRFTVKDSDPVLKLRPGRPARTVSAPGYGSDS